MVSDRFALLDQIPLGVCVLSPELTVLFWNTCLESWTGISRREILDQDLSQRFPHFREPRYALRLGTIFEGGPPAIFSSQLHRHFIPAPLPSGDRRIQHTVVTAIAAENGFDALVSIQDVTDLTRGLEERKRAEEERRQMETQVQHAQKLESLGVLAGGIAHDFNNLLVGILGNADLALHQVPPAAPGHVEVEGIIKASQRAADLAHQMLAYSGKGQFITRPLDLSESVEDALELIFASISKKAHLDHQLNSELPAIEADPTQVRQVVMNLVTNASDAIGEESGKIQIITGAEIFDSDALRDSYLGEDRETGLYVYLEVSDSGEGMSEDTVARIFDPFFTTKFAGRGLGLAAVLGIVRGHRGALMIRSEPGQGSTFRVLFPSCTKPAEGQATRRPGEQNAWTSKAIVLVVDDEQMVRDVARQSLETAGLTVITANDGVAALEILRDDAEHIAVVLLDMTMPELSGRETYEELRKIRTDLPVILSSGYTKHDAIRQVQAPGPLSFIQKPYRAMALVSKVRQALREEESPPTHVNMPA